jgi:hypothetical protein
MAGHNHHYVHDRKSGVAMMNAPQSAPMGKTYRVSSDSVFPLRGADGKTFAERRKEREQKQ